MNCSECQQEIDPERLEALPDTTICVSCASAKPDVIKPREIAQASVSARNGFAPSD